MRQCVVLDVMVDIRAGSPSFGKWEAIRLEDTTHFSVYVSEGLGHAFMALEDNSTVSPPVFTGIRAAV